MPRWLFTISYRMHAHGIIIFCGDLGCLEKIWLVLCGSGTYNLLITRSVSTNIQAPVVRRGDRAIHWINHYPMDNTIGFASVNPVDSMIHLLNNRGQKRKNNHCKHLQISRTFFPKLSPEIRGAAYLWEHLKKVAFGVQFSIFASDLMPGY